MTLVTGSRSDQSPAGGQAEPPSAAGAGPDQQAAARPWPAPGPDTDWWLGEAGPADHAGQTDHAGHADHADDPAEPGEAAGSPPAVGPPATSGATQPAIPAPARPAIPAPLRPAAQVGEFVTPPPIAVPAPAASHEDDPIWAGQPIGEWPTPEMKVGRPRRTATAATTPSRPVRRTKLPRRPLAGLAALLLFALVAAFFAWFSAEPIWLSLGHGIRGTATVAACPVHGIDKRCADFASDDGTVVALRVVLLDTRHVAAGEKVSARMVSDRGWAAYAGSPYPRWIPGLALVLLCGLGIAWSTGGYRLPRRRHRLAALAASVAGPLLLTVGMLAASW